MGQGYFLVRSRLRLTRDGGQSHLAVTDEKDTTGDGASTPVSGLGSPRSASSFGTMNSGSSSSSSSSETFAVTEASRSDAPPNATVRASDWSSVGSSAIPVAVVTPPVPSSTAPLADVKPIPSKYDGLVSFLLQRSAQGQPWALLSEIGEHRARNRHLYSQMPAKLLLGVEAAVSEGVLARHNRHFYSVHPDYDV
jgi:hypothetical protein